MLCYKCARNIPDNSLVCPSCGAEMSVFARKRQANGMEDSPFGVLLPMNWYRFLIYFSLIASAITNLSNGFLYITGQVYSIQSAGTLDAYMIYNQYGNELMITDIAYGVLTCLFAVFNLVTRSYLANFKKKGPALLYTMYAFGAAISLAYPLVLQLAHGVPGAFNSIIIFELVIECAILYANYIYFSKRKHMFVN